MLLAVAPATDVIDFFRSPLAKKKDQERAAKAPMIFVKVIVSNIARFHLNLSRGIYPLPLGRCKV
ncbi:hypothetical protein [Roseovarius sp. C03]|uniref:hypothetical protein n=1 Tax=Roseovarius sp. C03 TaxID=3449222 RepID=UPI003EDB9E76